MVRVIHFFKHAEIDVATSSFSIVGNNVELEFVNIILNKEMLFAIGMTPDHTYTYI